MQDLLGLRRQSRGLRKGSCNISRFKGITSQKTFEKSPLVLFSNNVLDPQVGQGINLYDSSENYPPRPARLRSDVPPDYCAKSRPLCFIYQSIAPQPHLPSGDIFTGNRGQNRYLANWLRGRWSKRAPKLPEHSGTA